MTKLGNLDTCRLEQCIWERGREERIVGQG